jgi:hypothetical protein
MFCLHALRAVFVCMFCLHVLSTCFSVLNVLSAYRYSLCLHDSHIFLLHVLSASTVCRFVYIFCLHFLSATSSTFLFLENSTTIVSSSLILIV